MALTTRAGLVAFVTADTHRSDLSSSMGDFLALAEGDINNALKTRPMMERWTATITSEFEALPSDFAGPRTMRLTSGTRRRVSFLTPDQMASVKAANPTLTGEPQYYTVLGDEFEFFPDPDGGSHDLAFTGFLRVPAMTADGDSTWLLLRHPHVYVAGMKRHIYRRARNSEQAALADSDFAGALSAIDRSALMESFADDLTPSVGLVV